MPEYIYPDDGKLHTRYSELKQCTAGQVATVVARRNGQLNRFESEHMEFGTLRHEMWQEESIVTMRVPVVFRELAGLDHLRIDHTEYQVATEIAPQVVVHSTIDAVCKAAETIIDYKTVLSSPNAIERAIRAYRASKQLAFYAYQLGLHGIEITTGIYLLEIWSEDREQILGYEKVEQHFSLLEISREYGWVLDRASMLKVEIERQQLYAN